MKRDSETEKKGRNKKKVFLTVGLLLILILISDMRLKTVVYTVETEKVSEPIRLALITDLHSCKYGKEQSTLIQAVEEQNPDFVLFGGDIFHDTGSYENAELTLKYLSERYPCYYVTGNHEYWSEDIDHILEIVQSYGVTVLDGTCETIEIHGETINLCGIDDFDAVVYTKNAKGITQQLQEIEETANPDCYTILLSHRPELVETYNRYHFDLVLAGHAHGGQWRIPGLLNGFYAPNQGIFPRYAGGEYELDNGKMIVSRGLARESTLAPRIFNRPELVIVDIK